MCTYICMYLILWLSQIYNFQWLTILKVIKPYTKILTLYKNIKHIAVKGTLQKHQSTQPGNKLKHRTNSSRPGERPAGLGPVRSPERRWMDGMVERFSSASTHSGSRVWIAGPDGLTRNRHILNFRILCKHIYTHKERISLKTLHSLGDGGNMWNFGDMSWLLFQTKSL